MEEFQDFTIIIECFAKKTQSDRVAKLDIDWSTFSTSKEFCLKTWLSHFPAQSTQSIHPPKKWRGKKVKYNCYVQMHAYYSLQTVMTTFCHGFLLALSTVYQFFAADCSLFKGMQRLCCTQIQKPAKSWVLLKSPRIKSHPNRNQLNFSPE